jgi:3-hydroxyisobutyrate dehydrogenase-like beta-hydroxyacid dehydrogenase
LVSDGQSGILTVMAGGEEKAFGEAQSVISLKLLKGR